MHRIDDPTATPDNRFTEGDPSQGVPATVVTAEWLNAVQEELAALVEGAGLQLDKAATDQVLDAVLALIAANAVMPDYATTAAAGIVELATAAEAQAGTDATRAVTPKALAAALAAVTVGAATTDQAGIVELATDAEAKAGTDAVRAVTPLALAAALRVAVPAGTVMSFAASAAPEGWLKCNGAAVSRTAYSRLFTAIGTTFGAGDGSTTFNVPDLRGEFLRGWDDGRGIDSGRTFGSGQGDAIRNITGAFDGLQYPSSENFTGAFGLVGNSGTKAPNADNYGKKADFDASRVVPTANENRPRNVALLACIKY